MKNACTKKISFLCLFLNAAISVLGQSRELEGSVISFQTNEPLQGVNIEIKGSSKGTTTDRTGNFIFRDGQQLKLSDTLIFSYVGYETKLRAVADIRRFENKTYLYEAIENLDEIILSSRGKLSPKVQFNEMSPMIKGVYGFGAVLTEDGHIIVMGGDQSYIEDNLRKRLKEDPTLSLPGSSIFDLATRVSSNSNWRHYSGQIQSYDIYSDTWKKLDLEIGERAYHNSILYQDSIYTIGGKRMANNMQREYLEDKIEILDLKGKKILVDMTNPHRAINFGTVVYGGNLVVFGGSKKVVSNGRKVYTNKVHIYSFSSGLWYELKSLSKEYETNGVLVNNTIYVIGGFDDRPLKEVRTYNIDTGENGEEAELFDEMSRPGLVCWRGIIYIFDNGKLLTYDTDMKVLKEYLIDFYVENANLTISKGSLYIIGGFKSKQFSKRPSQKMIRVNLNVLDRTRINRIKSF